MKKKSIFGVLLLLLLSANAVYAQSFLKTNLGVKVKNQSMDMEVQFYTPSIVRILKTPEGHSFEKESISVIKKPEAVLFKMTQNEDLLTLKSTALIVELNLKTGKVAYFNLEGKALFTEKENGTQFTGFDDAGNQTFNVQQIFVLDEDEAIYGLGQQQEGKMNQRNQTCLLQQENTKIGIPFINSVKGYGLFWDNYSSTTFTDDAQGMSFTSEVGDCSDYYFMYGGSMDGTVSCMRDLTGQAPLFPLWTWGYWQSKERYTGQNELVGIVQKYRDLGIPLDGIVQDWQYWSTDNAYWNGMNFRNPEFPQPEKMMNDIHRLNAHAIISVWPSFGPKTEPYKEFKKEGMLFGFETFPNADSVRVYNVFNPEARAIYWKYMNQNLFSVGLDGWWMDATEAEQMNAKKTDLDQSTGMGSFRKVRNAYPLLDTKGVYEHQRAVSQDKRVFILTRSAFAGQQRCAANSWSGDIVGDWETLRKQIPAGLNFSACGVPYWNTDIGGFWVRNGGSSAFADYRELYVRWLQFGTFCPMMRSHGTNTPREIWQFGQKGDWAYDAIEKFIRLRYALLPYHYSLSWDVFSKSASVMRMLSMDFPQDKNVLNMGQQYMYGQSFLVVPVTKPFYTSGQGEKSVTDFTQMQKYQVYLPNGSEWFDFWTGEKMAGGKEIQRETPIDEMPLYVKAGSIIPIGPNVQYAGEKVWDNLELRIYDGADAKFTLYEDEKDNYNYEKGVYSTISFKWNNAKRTLTIENRKGEFPGMLKNRTFSIVTVRLGKACGGKKTTNYDKIISYQGKKIIVKL